MRKRRLLSVLVGLSALGIVSLVFGMMMAVASDLPQLENKRQYGKETNSYLYDDQGRPIGIFAPPNHEVIDTFQQLGPTMRHAIVSVEDKRFWTDSGVDIRGTARAFLADVTGGATQGASTIAQQFVKNALAQEGNRTIFEKIREAALAFHLTHRWAKGKILDEYLNSIYFGNGAYGVESAARVYFGKQLGYDPNAGVDGSTTGCGDSTTTVRRPSCASQLNPAQAALLAGMVANPSAFNPLAFPTDAKARRDLVLQDMVSQRYITRAEYERYRNAPLPTAADIEQPQEPPGAPYFTSWLRPQILSAMGLGHGVPASEAEFRAYYGGLKIRTTIDLKMQQAAEHAIAAELPSGPSEPTASLVAIDNRTGEVRAMVGGPLVNGGQDYAKYPFNLATQGHRQPGSAFKPFTLAVALQKGYGPSSVLDSKPLDIRDPRACGQANYRPHNYNDEYVGPTTLAEATAQSDNSVFTQVGLAVGPDNVAKMATAAGIRSPISTNCSMIIGGLTEGVSPLDMAHAYETFAEGGRRVYDPVLGDVDQGPTGIAEIDCSQVKCRGKRKLVDQPHYRQVMPPEVAATVHELLSGVVTHGTGQAAQIPGVDVVGKTGTTNNEGDAWFVGWTPQITTAVWVGFPNKLIPMTSIYNGGPATGGTFPAQIWRSFTEQALQIAAQENAAKPSQSRSSTATGTTPATGTGTTPATATGTTPAAPAPTATGTTPAAPAPTATGTTPAAPAPTGGGTGATGGGGTTPVTPAPTGGGTGGGAGGGTGGTGGGTGGTGGGTGGTGGGTGGTGGGTGGRRRQRRDRRRQRRDGRRRPRWRIASPPIRLDDAIKSRLLASDGDRSTTCATTAATTSRAWPPRASTSIFGPTTMTWGSVIDRHGEDLPELLVARDRLRDDGAASSQDIAVCRPRSTPRHRHRVASGRPRQVPTARGAEPPRQLGGARDPDPAVADDLHVAPPRRAPRDDDRAGAQVGLVVFELDVERDRQLARPRAQTEIAVTRMRTAISYLALGAHPAAPPHQLQTRDRLQRPDEHRRPHPLGLADGVEQRVDAVGAVHVGAPGRAEQRRRAPGDPDVGVAGGLGLVVGLGLDDHAGRLAVAQHAADEIARDLDDRATVERRPQASAARARSSCSRTRSRPVAPSETLVSSHAPSSSSE